MLFRSHHSRPGTLGPNLPGGITAVFAHQLSRTEVFAALKDRRVYATTGKKIILDFRANDFMMGSINRVRDSFSLRPRIDINVVGTTTIDSIFIMKNDMPWFVTSPQVSSASLSVIDSDASLPVYYYVRVLQRDGHRAWTSPIWFVAQDFTDTNDHQVNRPKEFKIGRASCRERV